MATNTGLATRNQASKSLSTQVKNLGIGALVGVINNEEFSRGGRNLKFSKNAWVSYRPAMSIP